MVAPLLFFLIVRIFENKGFVHNPASLAVSAQGDDMMPFRHQDKLDGFAPAKHLDGPFG